MRMRASSPGAPAGRCRADHGAAIVEFALVFPLLLAFVMAIFSFGIAYNTRLTMNAAARDGARYAAVLDRSQTFAPGTTWGSAVTQRVVQRAFGSGVGSSDVCVLLLQGPTTGTEPATATVQPGWDFRNTAVGLDVCPTTLPVLGVGEQAVQVTVQRPARIEVLLFSRTVTLVTSSTMTYEATS